MSTDKMTIKKTILKPVKSLDFVSGYKYALDILRCKET